MLGAARAPAAGREAARARAGRKRCRRHSPPCPEEEAVAMVGALRGNAPDPPAPVRMRGPALRVCMGGRGTCAPHSFSPTPPRLGWAAQLQGEPPADGRRSRAGRPMAASPLLGGAGLPAPRCAARVRVGEALRGKLGAQGAVRGKRREGGRRAKNERIGAAGSGVEKD